LICLAILILWQTKWISRFSWSKIIQGPLVAVLAGIGLNLAFKGSGLMISEDHLVTLPTEKLLEQIQLPSLEMIGNSAIYVTALTLAIVASIESLLCAEATDKLDPLRRQTDLNQELKAQGIGNIASGMVGGLPVTQVIVRSSTNIQSGGKTRLASFFHGVLLIVCVAAIPLYLNMIPLASLAAILFVVGYKLAHPDKFKTMFKHGWTQFIPFIVTIVAILMTDLLIGIGIGLVVAMAFVLVNNLGGTSILGGLKDEWVESSEVDGKKVYTMNLPERLFFMSKGYLQNQLAQIEPNSKVIVDASQNTYIDQDVVDLLEDFETNAKFNNIELERIGSTSEHTAA